MQFLREMAFIVTGSSGFIGSGLVEYLAAKYPVLTVPRDELMSLSSDYVSTTTNFSRKLDSFLQQNSSICLIHCAGLAHKRLQNTADSLVSLFDVNVLLPLRLAGFCKLFKVSRFVFLSSIGVHGPSSALHTPITELSPLAPQTPYATSKMLAEQLLRESLFGSCVELSVIRPSLVYGRNMPGNLRTLLSFIDLCIPLPFACVVNKRSLVSLNNLVRAIEFISLSSSAAGEDFVIADRELISTPELIRCIALFRRKKCFLFPFPLRFLSLLSFIPLLGPKVTQLSSNLVVDSKKLYDDWGYSQPIPQSRAMEQAFSITFC